MVAFIHLAFRISNLFKTTHVQLFSLLPYGSVVIDPILFVLFYQNSWQFILHCMILKYRSIPFRYICHFVLVWKCECCRVLMENVNGKSNRQMGYTSEIFLYQFEISLWDKLNFRPFGQNWFGLAGSTTYVIAMKLNLKTPANKCVNSPREARNIKLLWMEERN